jgi:HEPN domain-containing protein
MPLDPALVVETRGWLAKAHKDLGAALHELTADPPFLEDIVFHAQQAAEKSMKAFLSWRGRPFRKTHNLVELG